MSAELMPINMGPAVAGQVIVLSDYVMRITAPNPSLMTGPGTNSYLVGSDELALIDPGPAIDEHIERIIDTAQGRLKWIVVTHTHTDHSPGWQAIAEATGAEVIGAPAEDEVFQDLSFQPHRQPQHDKLVIADEFTLRAVHTPGHVSNHFCYLLEEEGILFTGDHIMNGSTVVIVPPSGDMKAYIESLRLLLNYPLQYLAPGHGALIDNPPALLGWTIDRRLQREQLVIDTLTTEYRDIDRVLEKVYRGTDAALMGAARLSLLAHLIKLRTEGRAENDGENWRLVI